MKIDILQCTKVNCCMEEIAISFKGLSEIFMGACVKNAFKGSYTVPFQFHTSKEMPSLKDAG